MFYCRYCNNTLDIAKSIDTIAPAVGGAEPELTDSTIEIDVITNIINKILGKQAITTNEIKSISLPSVTKHASYKKLSSDDKEIVFNKINELLPKDLKVVSSGEQKSTSNIAFFLCNNCGHNEPIKPKTLIYSKSSSTNANNIVAEDQKAKVYSNILPRTRQYKCPNAKCESHKNVGKRIAVFYRLSGTYKMGYTCMACRETWTV